jgi:hypothetical protein
MRLRFTIRDLLWLTLVVALAVGWWIDRNRLNERAEKAEELFAKDHELHGDNRFKLINGLKSLGPETVDISAAAQDVHAQWRARELCSAFIEAGWDIARPERELVTPAHHFGVRLFIPSRPEALRQKGLAIAALFWACRIDVSQSESDFANLRIETGQHFMGP